MSTKAELEAQLAEAQAPSIFNVFSDARDTLCIISRMFKSQALKVETITDIATDAVLHSVQYVDVTTRANLASAEAKAKL